MVIIKTYWSFNVNLSFRREKESLIRLRELLTDKSKDERHRRNLISLHVTVLHWVVEFSGFALILLGTFGLGHGSATITLILQTSTIFIFFNLLPIVFLVNDSDFKAEIAESTYYLQFLRIFNCEKFHEISWIKRHTYLSSNSFQDRISNLISMKQSEWKCNDIK